MTSDDHARVPTGDQRAPSTARPGESARTDAPAHGFAAPGSRYHVQAPDGTPNAGCARGEVLHEVLLSDDGSASRRRVVVEYELLELVSSRADAAEGVTWRALRRPLRGGRGAMVALKVIGDSLNALTRTQNGMLDHYRRMVDQFHAVRGLRHSGLVMPPTVFLADADEHPWLRQVVEDVDGFSESLFAGPRHRPVAVTDWIQGVPLTRWGLNVADPRARVEILRPVAQAVDAMRHDELAFRDLKPSNVLVTGPGRSVLVDLGLVAPVAGGLRQGGYGTRGFDDPDLRAPGYLCDRFAFAATLVHQLTDASRPRWPASGAGMFEYARRTLYRPEIPEHLRERLQASLHAEVRGRPPEVQGLEHLLDEVLHLLPERGRGRRRTPIITPIPNAPRRFR
jgi:serine/threonine protein kinase